MAGEPSFDREGSPPAESPVARRRAPRTRRRRTGRWAWARGLDRKTWVALSLSGLLVVSFIAGIVYYWNQRQATEQDYVEVYVTDLPAEFTKLDVVVEGVYVGSGSFPLVLDSPGFDLLSLHGPDEALRLASGYVPSAAHEEIRIVFESARAELNGRSIPMELPNRVLVVGHEFGLGANPASAFLFDLNVDESIRVSADGLLFEPHVDTVYVHHYGAEPGEPGGPLASEGPGSFSKTDPKPFTNGTQKSPDRQTLAPGTPGGGSGSSSTTSKPRFTWNPPTQGPTTTTSPDPVDPGPTTESTTDDPLSSILPSPGGQNSVPNDPTDIGGWWGHFKDGAPPLVTNIVEEHGGVVYLILGAEPIVYFFATPGQAENISKDPNVLLVEADTFLHPHLQSSRAAIQLPQVSDPVLGLKDAAGNAIDGRGVGVAIVDLGIDGTHPDLPYKGLSPDPLVLANFKVESLFVVDAPSTDQSSGHGTHVAGILAGRGVLDPLQKGVAPGVKLYGFGIGETSTTLWPVTALDWILQNHDQVDPPIRVVQNSWGTFEPNAAIETLVKRLVAEGVVVVFSAGNAGGDGYGATTSYQCRIPAEGVVCVASFDDSNLGARDGRLAASSSRGDIGQPSTWPDLAAPGVSIRSTRPVAGLTTGAGLLDAYAVLSGTSMAAPHVSGVAALMLQMNPALTPAQVEAILESTAHPFADGGSYLASADARYDGSHYAKGHGLLDAHAAVQKAASP
ncbi:MAG: S8 family serine peptidase [Euryarchaeota archaeon]|nr:S8 family serine peptidase [Euryarchaeota archaeon]